MKIIFMLAILLAGFKAMACPGIVGDWMCVNINDARDTFSFRADRLEDVSYISIGSVGDEKFAFVEGEHHKEGGLSYSIRCPTTEVVFLKARFYYKRFIPVQIAYKLNLLSAKRTSLVTTSITPMYQEPSGKNFSCAKVDNERLTVAN